MLPTALCIFRYADIEKCFDRIDHIALLDKFNTFPTMRRAIRAWLKAGVVEDEELFATTQGTPQGGVASPLLANIALHGLETTIVSCHKGAKIVRYADDLVVMHPDLDTIKQIKHTVSNWLVSIGLKLKESKTTITHTLKEYEGNVGFDFLGFNVRQYRVGKTHSSKSTGRNPKLLGYKTLIKPSKEAVKRHLRHIKAVINNHRSISQARLIGILNPMIIGWAAYYASVVSKDTFDKAAHLTFVKLRNWARQRHNNTPWKWISRKYWRLEKGTWDFAPPQGIGLYRHSQTPIKRHTKVRANNSPYDGDWLYWAKRTGCQPDLPKRVATLLKWQLGKCGLCGLYFGPEQRLEVDHVIPLSMGGKDSYNNWQLLHAHCHHQKSADENRQRCS